MWTGSCDDCKNWEQENADLRQRLKHKDEALSEIESRLEALMDHLKEWEEKLDEVSQDIHSEVRRG